MDNKQIYLFIACGILLCLTCYGFFYLGVNFSCAGGYLNNYRCIEPKIIASCSELVEDEEKVYILPEGFDLNVSYY